MNQWSKYKNWTDWKTDPRKQYRINKKRVDISWYYWNLYHPDDLILPNGFYCIHHTDSNHSNNSKENLQKLTHGEHSSLHHKGINYRLGKILTKTTKKKISMANSKPVMANFIIYFSGRNAAKALNVNPETIRYRIKQSKPGYSYINKEAR